MMSSPSGGAAGAGPYSVDEQLLGGEIEFYTSVLEKVKGESNSK